ncbi:hypothetical protein LSAT2_013699 [Lamellibrachia satsuma]|nr:hypothetical protein LSAT2_013699 [Lamellibrachia satsuma]
MVLLVPSCFPTLDTGKVQNIVTRRMAEFIISVIDTEVALEKVKVNKATGPDNFPSWVLKDFLHLLAAPVTAIFNSSLREGVLPKLWKSATVIPLSKKQPPDTVENDIRPISLTPILAKFESLVLKWVDICVKPQIDDRQFGVWQGLVLLVFWLKCFTSQGPIVQVTDVSLTQPPQMVVQSDRNINSPSDGLFCSIFVTLFGCFPVGIFAIVRSVQCRSAIHRGDLVEAKRLSKSSRTARSTSLGLAISIIMAVAIYLVFVKPHQ